jgi:hypothetical protein
MKQSKTKQIIEPRKTLRKTIPIIEPQSYQREQREKKNKKTTTDSHRLKNDFTEKDHIDN